MANIKTQTPDAATGKTALINYLMNIDSESQKEELIDYLMKFDDESIKKHLSDIVRTFTATHKISTQAFSVKMLSQKSENM